MQWVVLHCCWHQGSDWSCAIWKICGVAAGISVCQSFIQLCGTYVQNYIIQFVLSWSFQMPSILQDTKHIAADSGISTHVSLRWHRVCSLGLWRESSFVDFHESFSLILLLAACRAMLFTLPRDVQLLIITKLYQSERAHLSALSKAFTQLVQQSWSSLILRTNYNDYSSAERTLDYIAEHSPQVLRCLRIGIFSPGDSGWEYWQPSARTGAWCFCHPIHVFFGQAC